MEFDGASGHIKFDEDGDVSGNYEVYLVKDGTFAPAPADDDAAENDKKGVEKNDEATGTEEHAATGTE